MEQARGSSERARAEETGRGGRRRGSGGGTRVAPRLVGHGGGIRPARTGRVRRAEGAGLGFDLRENIGGITYL